MKRKLYLNLLISLMCLSVSPIIIGCDENSTTQNDEWVDYVAQCKFNSNSGRVYEVTTVHKLIDGDTTHFNVSWAENGVYKARYLGVDTPESTGQIQPWGKAASKFTASKLSDAYSIIIESDTAEWNLDSTGGRYTTWVWYQSTAEADYRLLNLELVQEGLTMLKAAGDSTYGSYFTAAFQQAKNAGLKVAGNKTDPDYYYGGPTFTTISELVLHPETYKDTKVRVEGLVTKVDDTTFYFESYDEVYSQSFGMDVFMGYSFSGQDDVNEGNIMSVEGMFAWSDIVDKYQISDLKYFPLLPNHEENTKVVSTGNEVIPTPITGDDLSGTVEFEFETEDSIVKQTFDKGYTRLFTRVSATNLTVKSAYTTNNGGSNDGAITLTCNDANGKEITIRTSVLYNANREIVKQSEFEGKTISVVGTVDCYTSDRSEETLYQIHAFHYKDITIL